MKSIHLSVLLTALSELLVYVVLGADDSSIHSKALNSAYHVKIGDKYNSEIQCLQKLDRILKRKWSSDLKKIPTSDVRNIKKVLWEVKDSSYTRFNTFEEEWLMKDDLPAKRLEQCFRDLVPVVVPFMNQADIDCLNELFYHHVVSELDKQSEFEKLLDRTSHQPLPFREFISFIELVDLLFQNRNPDSLTDLERVLYEHAESYLLNDEDRTLRTYIGNQDCEWKNARALREVSSEAARFQEFTSQVRSTTNKLLAARLIKSFNLNSTLPRERYDRWLKARERMIPTLEKEVQQIRKQKKDAQWLCEYATTLAAEFSDEQANILLMDDKSLVHFEVSDIASRARAIEKALEKMNDFRRIAIKSIADKYEEGTRCMFAFLHLVQNHRRHDLTSAFIEEPYSYPEIFCTGNRQTNGLIQMNFCNCIGSFCIAHPLAALFADEYTFAKGSDGVYQVVRSGRKSRRKIMHCHILANGNNILSIYSIIHRRL